MAAISNTTPFWVIELMWMLTITSARASTVRPSLMSCATVRPSRAPSITAAEISATASG